MKHCFTHIASDDSLQKIVPNKGLIGPNKVWTSFVPTSCGWGGGVQGGGGLEIVKYGYMEYK